MMHESAALGGEEPQSLGGSTSPTRAEPGSPRLPTSANSSPRGPSPSSTTIPPPAAHSAGLARSLSNLPASSSRKPVQDLSPHLDEPGSPPQHRLRSRTWPLSLRHRRRSGRSGTAETHPRQPERTHRQLRLVAISHALLAETGARPREARMGCTPAATERLRSRSAGVSAAARCTPTVAARHHRSDRGRPPGSRSRWEAVRAYSAPATGRWPGRRRITRPCASTGWNAARWRAVPNS